jgi:uncharacterized protein (DUF924 family)
MDDVLAFWFTDPARAWRKDPGFDDEVRRRFGALHDEIMRGEHTDWLTTPRGALAYVIVLDQFSRNIYRDDPRAFAGDRRALEAAGAAIAAGHDRALSADERGFLYMPYMHSENLADQDRCVELFRDVSPYQLEFAEQHRDIIARFGRFPHRNAIVGRDTTREEHEFLKQPGSSF